MAISDEEAYKQGKRIAEAMQQGTYNTSKDYSDKGSKSPGGSIKFQCKKCGEHINTPVCPNCGRIIWGGLSNKILSAVLISIGVFLCGPGGWRWFWIIIGGVFALGEIIILIDIIILTTKHKQSKQVTTTETNTQKIVEKTEASSHLHGTPELQNANQTPDEILKEKKVNPLQNFDPVAQAQHRGKQRGMQYGKAGIESYRLLANALQSVPSLSASDSRLPKKTWHLSFDELIEKIDFHLGQSASQGTVVSVAIRHGLFVFVNVNDFFTIEIAKLNEDSYLIWDDPHDPTFDSFIGSPPLSSEMELEPTSPSIFKCERCEEIKDHSMINDQFAGRLWQCITCGYKTVRY